MSSWGPGLESRCSSGQMLLVSGLRKACVGFTDFLGVVSFGEGVQRVSSLGAMRREGRRYRKRYVGMTRCLPCHV